jgi:signal transduction histidine kinase
MAHGTGGYPFPSVPIVVRRALALVSVVIVFLAYRNSGDVIDDGGLFLLLSVAVLGSAWFAGTGAALSVTVFGAILGSMAGPALNPAVQTHLALFVGQGLLLTALVAELRSARRRAEQEAGIAEAAKREIEAASHLKDEFLGTISHELRTPLNAVLGWVHLIRTGKLDAAAQARGFESIERNVRLQAQLTGDLLDVSKALTGRLKMEMRPVSLIAVVSEAVAQVSTAATAKDVTLHAEQPDQPIIVRGDPNRLRQVVWHLLANAIKFTPRGGAIDVLVQNDGLACVTVGDTGPGIARDFLPRIFDRFTQADSSPTRPAGGLGVGLALVRELVERHGGEIVARNRDGGGAEFTIQLPLHRIDQGVRAVMPAPALVNATSPPLDGLRVLLLDHDEDVRELLTVALQQRGASVRGAGTVDTALELLESWRPDVLVSDALSPEHDAYAVVGKVHALEADRGGRIPALALTSMAWTSEEMRKLLTEVKRDLPKPVEPSVLTAEIARLAGRERRQHSRHG